MPSIKIDPIWVRQILGNLIVNMSKLAARGDINLRAFREKDRVCFEINHPQVDLNEAEVKEIFENFSRIDGDLIRRAKHVGLNLAVTRHLVHMQGGNIDIRSRSEEGTTFIVRLPFQQQAKVETIEKLKDVVLSAA